MIVGKQLSCNLLKLMFAAGIKGTDSDMLNRIGQLMDRGNITTNDLRQRTRESVKLLQKGHQTVFESINPLCLSICPSSPARIA